MFTVNALAAYPSPPKQPNPYQPPSTLPPPSTSAPENKYPPSFNDKPSYGYPSTPPKLNNRPTYNSGSGSSGGPNSHSPGWSGAVDFANPPPSRPGGAEKSSYSFDGVGDFRSSSSSGGGWTTPDESNQNWANLTNSKVKGTVTVTITSTISQTATASSTQTVTSTQSVTSPPVTRSANATKGGLSASATATKAATASASASATKAASASATRSASSSATVNLKYVTTFGLKTRAAAAATSEARRAATTRATAIATANAKALATGAATAAAAASAKALATATATATAKASAARSASLTAAAQALAAAQAQANALVLVKVKISEEFLARVRIAEATQGLPTPQRPWLNPWQRKAPPEKLMLAADRYPMTTRESIELERELQAIARLPQLKYSSTDAAIAAKKYAATVSSPQGYVTPLTVNEQVLHLMREFPILQKADVKRYDMRTLPSVLKGALQVVPPGFQALSGVLTLSAIGLVNTPVMTVSDADFATLMDQVDERKGRQVVKRIPGPSKDLAATFNITLGPKQDRNGVALDENRFALLSANAIVLSETAALNEYALVHEGWHAAQRYQFRNMLNHRNIVLLNVRGNMPNVNHADHRGFVEDYFELNEELQTRYPNFAAGGLPSLRLSRYFANGEEFLAHAYTGLALDFLVNDLGIVKPGGNGNAAKDFSDATKNFFVGITRSMGLPLPNVALTQEEEAFKGLMAAWMLGSSPHHQTIQELAFTIEAEHDTENPRSPLITGPRNAIDQNVLAARLKNFLARRLRNQP